jgi:hypothetical protein
VEDEENALSDWAKKIEFHNADEGNRPFEIVPYYAHSVSSAQSLLASTIFDAIVVDLRLKPHEGASQHNDQGNEIVELLASTAIVPVAIYTGQPQEARIPENSSQVTVIPKGEGLDTVLSWLSAQSVLISHMQFASESIQRDMASTFHRSIWPRWKYWMDGSVKDDVLRSAVTRHLVSHLYVALLESNNGEVHSEECYFVPPISSASLATGDLLLRKDGVVEVVITPRCDIAHPEKASTIQLAECENQTREWELLTKEARGADPSKSSNAKGKMKQWRQHKSKNVLHFLPEMRRTADGSILGPWFVRFDRIRSVPKDSSEHTELASQRFASITSEFLPSLVERIGGFFSRIGTPDIS